MKTIAALLSLLLVFAASPAIAAHDWTRSVAATPAGGYLIGNPKAPVKIIEYFSLTCPHCRHFSETGLPALKTGYVARGKVNLELRNFVLNPYDLAASVLMRCNSPAMAVHLFDAAFADQDKLFSGARDLSQEAVARISGLPMDKRTGELAREAGIDRWFVAHGLSVKRASACLADPNSEKRLADLRENAMKTYDVQGTPTFIVNGKVTGGITWDELEPVIKTALGGTAG